MVLIRHAIGEWHEPASSAYENEKALQDLVKFSPSLLPGETPIVVVDEFTIPEIGSVDLLGVGIGGEITIVECKLKANPEIRREVVGQVLAYAGGLWHMGYDAFAATFARRLGGRSLISAISEVGNGPVEEEELRHAVTQRLEAGEFRLIIAVDEITPELKTIVEYLNEHTLSSVHVLAFELSYAREGDLELLIPAVYGEEAGIRKGLTSTTGWTADTFAEQFEKRTVGPVHTFVEDLLWRGTQDDHKLFYGFGSTPSVSCKYQLGDRPKSVWVLYLSEPTPSVVVNFGSIDSWSHAAAVTFLNELKGNELLAMSLGAVDETNLNKKFPSITIDPVLTDPVAQSTFFLALDHLGEGT